MAAMYSMSVGSVTSRKSLTVSGDDKIPDVFTEAGVTFDGAVIYLNSVVIPPDDAYNKTLEEIGNLKTSGSNLLTAIVKADSAR